MFRRISLALRDLTPLEGGRGAKIQAIQVL